MEEVIRYQDQYYILATSSRADERTRVMKHGDTFAIFDQFGDIVPFGLGEQGLYHGGTRYLSRLELIVNGERPLLLSSSVREDNDLFVVDLTNPDIPLGADQVFRRNILHVFRSVFLWEAACYQRLRLTNHGLDEVTLSLTQRVGADFADIFEVRGTPRPRRGRLLPPRSTGSTLVLGYEGLDGIVRQTTVECSPPPTAIQGDEMVITTTLAPQTSETIYCTIRCETTGRAVRVQPHDHAFEAVRGALVRGREQQARIETANEQFNAWIGRSTADLQMMLTATPYGKYPYAGVPWFSTVFGRDGIITALELLWIEPAVASAVLGYLAATQATGVNPEQDAEPGKILHETRSGEMAALGEIPFGRYYGSVDSTPLFVLLAAAYYERTADRAFIESIWPNIEAALAWIDKYGDQDGDGFVEYIRHTSEGLVHQGWKDSQDSVFHENGALAEPPIALCEVQAYVYAAKRQLAGLASELGDEARAAQLAREAETLRDRFERAFWAEELSAYAIALDGRKQPCLVRSSNAGHCLFGKVASPERARAVARALTGDDMFSGWGVRTVGASAVRYNPMSYHNGSIWPHDNAMVARGFSNYGLTDAATAIFRGLSDLSHYVDQHRLPELVCGFHRRPGEGPTLYPVACAPQSWAAAAVFLLLQSSLGIFIRAPQKEIVFEHALLPDFLPWVRILNLRVGDATIDLHLERHPFDVGIQVLRRTGDVQVVAVK